MYHPFYPLLTDLPASSDVLLSEQDVYKMKDAVRGRAIIISNEYFSVRTLTARYGNAADVMNLKKLLQALHFNVETVADKTDEVPVVDNLQHNIMCILLYVHW